MPTENFLGDLVYPRPENVGFEIYCMCIYAVASLKIQQFSLITFSFIVSSVTIVHVFLLDLLILSIIKKVMVIVALSRICHWSCMYLLVSSVFVTCSGI